MANYLAPLVNVVSDTEPALLPGPDKLTGQHVVLERLTQNHFDDLYENFASYDESWTWLSEGPFNTSSSFTDWLRPFLDISAKELVLYAIIPLSGPCKGKTVGLASLLGADLTNRVIELGVLFGPQLQRTRAATEVVFLLACLVIEKLHFRRLEWKCDSLNLRSQKAADRYGFVYEGTIRQHRIVKGRNRDSCSYSLIDSEWPVCRKVFETWLKDFNFDDQGQQRLTMREWKRYIDRCMNPVQTARTDDDQED